MSRDKKFEVVYNHLITKKPNLDTIYKKYLDEVIDKIAAIVDSPTFIWEGQRFSVISRSSIGKFDDRIFLYEIHESRIIDPVTYNTIVRYICRYAQPDCKNHIRISKINSILEG